MKGGDAKREARLSVNPAQKGGIRIGVTGPPGVGKSTVTADLNEVFTFVL